MKGTFFPSEAPLCGSNCDIGLLCWIEFSEFMHSMAQYFSVSNCTGHLDYLEQCLRDILFLIKPSEADQRKRINTISNLEAALGSVKKLEGAVVKPFGSFISNLYTKWGDLDICIQFPDSSMNSMSISLKKRLLMDIMRALRKNGATRFIEYIPSKRVPILKFESSYSGISCDISINNDYGLIKSKILFWISEIDERFRDMVLLTKEWAKTQHINDPKLRTLNSYSLCLLVIFHFQTCEPAILPPLKEIYEGNILDDITGSFSESHIEDFFSAHIKRFRSESSAQRNKSSLSQLLISFFHKFEDIESLANQYSICTYTGQFESIRSIWREKSYSLIVEDPFQQSENAARAVCAKDLSIISNKFKDAYNMLSSSTVHLERNVLLATLTRPDITSKLQSSRQVQYNSHAHAGGAQYPCLFSGHNALNGTHHPASSVTDHLKGEGIRSQENADTKVKDGYSQLQNAPKQDDRLQTTKDGKSQFNIMGRRDKTKQDDQPQTIKVCNSQFENAGRQAEPYEILNHQKSQSHSAGKQDQLHERVEGRHRRTTVRRDMQQLTTPSPNTLKKNWSASTQSQQLVWRPKSSNS